LDGFEVVHIVFLVQRFPGYGGAEEYVRRIASGLVLNYKDYKCTIIASDLDKRVIQGLPKEINLIRLPVFFKVREYALWRGLFKKLLEINADVFHANNYGYWHVDALALFSWLKRDFKIVFTTHGWEGFELSMLKKRGILPHKCSFGDRSITSLRPIYDFTLGKMELSSADALIALSPRESILFRFMKVPNEKIFEILPGVDDGFFQLINEDKIESVRSEFNSEPLLLTVGRLCITKGQDVAIRTMRLLANEFPKAKLLVIGKDDGRLSYLKNLVNSLGLEKNVCFTGYLGREELILLFKAADFLVHTSYAEGVSLTALEALAAGLPIVSTPVGGIPYLLKRSGAGCLVPYNNPAAIYSVIKFLMENPKILRNTKNKALKFGQNLSWSCAVKEHEKVYRLIHGSMDI
jgi:glycosyltransferase involved in cell wall biosynthesis